MPCTRKWTSPRLRRLVLEHADELLADDPPLLLGVGDPGQAATGSGRRRRRARAAPGSARSNASTTCSASSLRSRPWSTKTQVSWSPTARWTSSAATAESTPPDSAQITRSSPTWARIRSTCSSMNWCAVQVGGAWHASSTNCPSISVPRGVCSTSGWNCTAYRPRSRSSIAAIGRRLGRRGDAEAGGHLGHAVAVAHPAALLARQLAEQQAALPRARTGVLPNSPMPGVADLAAEGARHRLHAVADAEHRHAELEQLRVDVRRARLVDRGRAAGEDDPARLARGRSRPPACRAATISE